MPKLFVVFGATCLFLAAFLIWQRNTPRRLSFRVDSLHTQQTSVVSSKIPRTLIIKDLGIELPVIGAKLENGRWEATGDGVSYLVSSAVPGEVGNSILYGHNWPNLLGKLPKAKPGQDIYVVFDDGTTKRFVIEYTSVVTPDQTHILGPSRDARLTIYTCTGFLDTKRFVVTAVVKE